MSLLASFGDDEAIEGALRGAGAEAEAAPAPLTLYPSFRLSAIGVLARRELGFALWTNAVPNFALALRGALRRLTYHGRGANRTPDQLRAGSVHTVSADAEGVLFAIPIRHA